MTDEVRIPKEKKLSVIADRVSGLSYDALALALQAEIERLQRELKASAAQYQDACEDAHRFATRVDELERAQSEPRCRPLTPDEAKDLQAAYWPGECTDEVFRKLLVAVMQADRKFEAAKAGGSKTWIEGFLLPELNAQGLEVALKASHEPLYGQWRPIDTAPVTSKLLLYWDVPSFDGRGRVMTGRYEIDEDGDGWVGDGDQCIPRQQPTHWMPLPGAPSTQSVQQNYQSAPERGDLDVTGGSPSLVTTPESFGAEVGAVSPSDLVERHNVRSGEIAELPPERGAGEKSPEVFGAALGKAAAEHSQLETGEGQ